MLVIAVSQGWGQETASQKRVEAAVAQLVAEANAFEDTSDTAKVKPNFTRPHPALARLQPEDAPAVLERMTRSFPVNRSGDSYRETFIRWHLLEVVKKATPEERRKMGSDFAKLLGLMPAPLRVQTLPEWHDEPAEISARWHSLFHSTHVTVGYPPFQRHLYGRDALAEAPDGRKAAIQAAVEEMDKIRPLWRRVVNVANQRFNTRVGTINYLIRQYRGELIYEVLRTKDPTMLRRVGDEIVNRVRQKQRVAFDLLSYVYMASFSGELSGYDHQDLKALGEQLKAAARSAEGYVEYVDDPRDDLGGRSVRNFADYAFHLIHTLESVDIHGLPGDSVAPTDAE